MTELDVQQSDIDYKWYLADKCPIKTEEEKTREKNTKRIAKIKAELEEIDKQSQRSARAIALVLASVMFQQPANALSINKNTLVADGVENNLQTFDPDDLKKLTELENQAGKLREELKTLEDKEGDN